MKRLASPSTLIAACLLAIPVQAALTISNTDISGGQYTYSLSYADMATTKFTDDVFSRSTFGATPSVNTTIAGTGSGERHFVGPVTTINDTNFKSASFTYKFDFSTTSFRPTALSLRDGVYLFSGNGVTAGSVTTEYSLDNVNWTPIRTVSTLDGSSSGVTSISLSSMPDTVYYRVNFTATSGSFGFGSNAAQWARSASTTSPNPFVADFTVTSSIPEPSTYALLSAMAALTATGFMLRRRS